MKIEIFGQVRHCASIASRVSTWLTTGGVWRVAQETSKVLGCSAAAAMFHVLLYLLVKVFAVGRVYMCVCVGV